jgi:hypothetical protein
MEMNYKHTFEAAMANLGDLMNLLKDLSEKDSVSTIEIDLALQKTRNLYEVLLLLKQDENNKQKIDRPVKVKVSHVRQVTENGSEAKEPEGMADETFELSHEEPVERESSTRIPGGKREEKKILSDSLKGKAILGESLHQNVQYQDLSSQFHAKPVTDLAKAIGINEKYLYIRELFGNDSKKFEKAIQIINNAPNFNEAYNYMIREYTWDMDSELVQGLLEIVRRKYITGQHE